MICGTLKMTLIGFFFFLVVVVIVVVVVVWDLLIQNPSMLTMHYKKISVLVTWVY
jgi:hypothetical protein